VRKLGTQTVIFFLGTEEYGFPVDTIQEITRFSKIHTLPGVPDYVKGLINIRGQAIPLIDLGKKFGVQSNADSDFALILEMNGLLVGMAVDEVREVITVDSAEPPPSIVKAPFISGIINLTDRMIIQVIPEKVLEEDEIKDLGKLAV